MHTSFFKGALTKTIYLRTSLKLGMLNQGSSFSSLKPLSASLGLCGLHFRWSFAALFVLLAAQPVCLVAQNIPPMIGDHVGKPKLRIPNPLENSQGNNQTSQSSQSGQMAVSPGGEREIHGFLDNWRSSLSKKDVEALGSCYLQTDALRVYWESQEFDGWEAYKMELQRRSSSPEGIQLELKEPKISVFGRFAWVTAHYLHQSWAEAVPKSQEGLMTLVLEKRRSAWVILHQHTSVASTVPPTNISNK